MNEAQFFSCFSEPFRPRPLAPDVMFDVEVKVSSLPKGLLTVRVSLSRFVLVVAKNRFVLQCLALLRSVHLLLAYCTK